MALLSAEQVARLALEAGLPPDRAARFVAIAKYESGGGSFPVDSNAHNPKPPDDSYGIWQINMYGNLGPGRRQTYGLRTNADLYDPATNARVMASLSGNGATTQPWTTAKLVTAADLEEGRKAVAKVAVGGLGDDDLPGLPNPIDAATDAIDAVRQGLDAIGSFLAALMSWSTWARILQIALGVGLIGAAVGLLTSDTIGDTLAA